jgi:hypothetical protein
MKDQDNGKTEARRRRAPRHKAPAALAAQSALGSSFRRPPRKATQTLQALGPNGEQIRASHWRYSHAKLALIERGLAPTGVAIAKELGINRVTLCKFRARYPWLDEWVNDQALAVNVHLWGLVERRHALLGIQGSVASAELYLKMQRGTYSRAGAPGDPDAPGGDDRIIVNHNYLVPRPDYSQLAGPVVSSTPAPALPPASASVPAIEKKKIPVIAVR